MLPAQEMGAARGHPVTADAEYMIGVANELAERHVPEVAPRNDTLVGPVGRHADRAGWWYLIHREDLRLLAPLWLEFTQDVRFDPAVSEASCVSPARSRGVTHSLPRLQAWNSTGDTAARKPGDRPWIAEMYGWAFAAAKLGLWHGCDRSAMLYPSYSTAGALDGGTACGGVADAASCPLRRAPQGAALWLALDHSRRCL